jgi:hypothetical protein
MTRARTASFGVGSLAAIQPLLDAVLMLCVSLVHHAATTFRMIFTRRTRDWHTGPAHEALPQATSGPHLQKDTLHPHGVMLGPVPSISVGTAKGLTIDPLETRNRDARHKGEHDSVAFAPLRMEAGPLARIPGAGRHPALRAAQTHAHRRVLMSAVRNPALVGDRNERVAPTPA